MKVNQLRIVTLVVIIAISLTLLTLLPAPAKTFRTESSEPQRLTVEIKPQPANGYSGGLYFTFNQAIAPEVEVSIHDVQGRLHFKMTYATHQLRGLYFGQHLPALNPGNYHLTVVSDKLVTRKILAIK